MSLASSLFQLNDCRNAKGESPVECEDITAIDDTALGSIVHPAETGAFNSERHVALVEHFSKEKGHLVKRRGNKQVIWEEYRLAHPDGYSYSQYCLLWRQYLKGMDISLPPALRSRGGYRVRLCGQQTGLRGHGNRRGGGLLGFPRCNGFLRSCVLPGGAD